MAGPEGCFFGEKVTRDVSKKIDVKEGLLLHISHACLDHASKGPVSLYVNNGGEDYVICTLKDYGHATLDLNFSSSFVLKVKGEGKNAVHVSGYWEFVADPEMEMMEEEEEDEEEEEVAAPPAKKAVAAKASPKEVAKEAPKKSPKQAAKEAPAKKAAVVEPEMDDEEDLESLTPSLLEMLNGMEEFEEFEEEEEEEVPVPVKAPVAGKKRAAVEAPPAKKAKTETKPQKTQAQPPKKQEKKQQEKKQEKKQQEKQQPPAGKKGGKKGGKK